MIMKNWNLFANGKFKARDKYGNVVPFNASLLSECEEGEYPTLIARPISDMTAGEWNKISDYSEVVFHHEHGIRIIFTNNLSAELMLHLLSIGVYPFDQSHFDDGTVINANSLEEA